MTKETATYEAVRELVNAAYEVVTGSQLGSWATHATTRQISERRLVRLMRALQAMPITPTAEHQIGLRLTAYARKEAKR